MLARPIPTGPKAAPTAVVKTVGHMEFDAPKMLGTSAAIVAWSSARF
jgi:hypothetical protein